MKAIGALMRKNKKVTMQDIADRLEISKVTVSKALNHKEGVGAQLKKKIQAAACEMGYIMPDMNKKDGMLPKSIAILLNEKFAGTDANFYLRCYQRLSFELSILGYYNNLFIINKMNRNKDDLIKLFNQNNICGVILLGEFKKSFINEFKTFHMPSILMDCYDMDSGIDCVITENIYSTYALTNHLLENGHREIGFVGTVSSTSSIQDRFLGYCRAMIEKKITINREWILDDRDEENGVVAVTLPINLPTAFVCNCDDTAYYFVKLLNEHGYEVPRDISIVSFDGDIYAELCKPKLTTVAVDIILMAKRAAELIINKVEESGATAQGVTFVKGKIIYRDSVRNMNHS